MQRWFLTLLVQSIIAILVGALVIGGTTWRYERQLKEQIYWFTNVRGHVHTAAMVHALKPQAAFKDCSDCPEMIVIPAGSFQMGARGEGSAFLRPLTREAAQAFRIAAVSGRDPSQCR
jgi:formylglycine-generating enzyme required for sulfatase activity